MSQGRFDAAIIIGGVVAFAAIFAAAAQGLLHISGKISDSLLALIAALVLYRLWCVWRRRSRHGG